MQIFGVQLPPLLHVPVQFALVVTEQVPSAAQQDPDGWVQVFGEQDPPLLQVPEQFALVVTVQVPSAAQQEPVGWVQMFGEQLPVAVHIAPASSIHGCLIVGDKHVPSM